MFVYIYKFFEFILTKGSGSASANMISLVAWTVPYCSLRRTHNIPAMKVYRDQHGDPERVLRQHQCQVPLLGLIFNQGWQSQGFYSVEPEPFFFVRLRLQLLFKIYYY